MPPARRRSTRPTRPNRPIRPAQPTPNAPAHGRRRSRGQALVEFALVVPVMIVLVLGGVDAGRLFFSWIEISNAAREGAAYAGGNPTDTTGISSHVTREANSQGQPGEGTISVATTCADTSKTTIACSSAAGGNGTGNTVTVSVTRPFNFVTPVLSQILGSSVTIGGSATSAVYGYQPNDGSGGQDTCDKPDTPSFTVQITDHTVAVDASASTPNSGRCAIASYAWDWGDGVDNYPPPVGKQTSYTYGADGTYTITLTVSNPGGSKSTTVTVTVPPPSPSITPSPTPTPTPTDTPSPSPTNPCSMTPTFTYTEEGNSGKFNFFGAYTGQPAPNSWFWWFGDGYVGSGQAPSQHRYSGNGPYTVVLLITNGSCQSQVSQNVYP
jgi:Flp pilus assembly protein TadG